MIGFLRGKVSHLMIDQCFIDVQGVGYRVYISGSTRNKLHLQQEVTLFTYLHVREDALVLYGFFSQDEYELFYKLLSVSGIGPKVALGILSSITVENLCRAIQQKQLSILTKLPGIGKKSAERLILELKDKLPSVGGDTELDFMVAENMAGNDDVLTEATAALAALGYTQAEIIPVLKKSAKLSSVEEIIKFALKEFAGRN